MPKRKDLHKILIIGSGPIIIGQACEFDYSGTQACKALKEEGYEVVLVNSNPATIMTDPEMATRTYIEPLTVEVLERVIERERPDALLPTLGGQTALNLAVALFEKGILEKYNVELIGAKYEVIQRAENRLLFKETLLKAGIEVPRSIYTKDIDEGKKFAKEVGYPVIIRPSFTLGGTGSAIAYNEDEFVAAAKWGINTSPVKEILVEESVLGWKEYELEVMRDYKDNVVIVCPIENFDPMGVHTGDSITVAPAQTLTDKEYQNMRDWAIKIMRVVGVETGGSNIQFAVNPENGRMVAIEMNPRVSRSSALASKATGFPIAKIAAKLAVGYSLDEIPNDITKKTPACFEPTIDYCVVKVPRFTFEKFKNAKDLLGTSMKSIGETMAIGRTFKEALQKALRGLEMNYCGLDYDDENEWKRLSNEELENKLRYPNSKRIFAIKEALLRNFTIEKIYGLSKIDPWFINQIKEIVEMEKELIKYKNKKNKKNNETKQILHKAKQYGFSDKQIGKLWNCSESEIRKLRKKHKILPTYKLIDTCAAEFPSYTPYFYSTYDEEDEITREKRCVVIIGSGPNRIGQGIEFDYCCVHAVFALHELNYRTVMINSNPETVSTDYETCDHLYFEPVTLEDVLNVVEKEKPVGVMIQFGGQTPINLALSLEKNKVKILGTQPKYINIAEDRKLFAHLLDKLKIPRPDYGTAMSFKEARVISKKLGYPVMVRPSYVLGGRAMEIVESEEQLYEYIRNATKISPEHPVLIDKFLTDAIEIDVDAVCDGEMVYIGGIMEHIEEAGIHSGDSACVLPPYSLSPRHIEQLEEYTELIAFELHTIGLINIQYAIKDNIVYVLEANPRASRTVPFVSKATGVPLAKLAAKVCVGKKLKNLLKEYPEDAYMPKNVSVKEVLLPFSRFDSVDTLLGPEMRSTGEVMGIDYSFPLAFAKAQDAANNKLPLKGTVFFTVRNEDKPKIIRPASKLYKAGFKIVATKNTAKTLQEAGIPAEIVYKLNEGTPNSLDLIYNKKVDLIVNTPSGPKSRADGYHIRRAALENNIPIITTIPALEAAVKAILVSKEQTYTIKSLQEYHSSWRKK
jgi:carbamoyl-phosphate synthase large subunit